MLKLILMADPLFMKQLIIMFTFIQQSLLSEISLSVFQLLLSFLEETVGGLCKKFLLIISQDLCKIGLICESFSLDFYKSLSFKLISPFG